MLIQYLLVLNTFFLPETKIDHNRNMISTEILQVLPALNYAESEMEKCPLKPLEEPFDVLEKHLQNFAALICPGMLSSPSREVSMFPDQYDVPAGFPWIVPKWTEEAGSRLKTYLKSSQCFEISVMRALELLASGKQQRSDDHDDEVYYYISSPEPSDVVLERQSLLEPDLLENKNASDEVKNSAERQSNEQENGDAHLDFSVLSNNVGIPDTAATRADLSPKEVLPTEHHANSAEHSKKTSGSASVGGSNIGKCLVDILKENFCQAARLLPVCENNTLSISDIGEHCEMEVENQLSKTVNCLSAGSLKSSAQKSNIDKDVPLKVALPTVILGNQTNSVIEVLAQTSNNVHDEMSLSTPKLKRRGKRRKKKAVKRITSTFIQKPSPTNTNVSPCSIQSISKVSASETMHLSHNSLKKDWRSLPRRKKHWIANETVKRTLRSDIKTSEIELYSKTSDTETNGINLEAGFEEKMVNTSKRKEGFNMRERYGLKKIITDCGRVFVPHGMDVAAGDVKVKICETKETQDFVTTSSPLKERPTNTFPLEVDKGDQLMPLTQNISVIKSFPFKQITNQDNATHTNSEQLLDSECISTSPDKIKNKLRDSVYRAISISKLKTVLKRAKKTGTGEESATKKLKPIVHTEAKISDFLHQNADSAESPKPTAKTTSNLVKENGRNVIKPLAFLLCQHITRTPKMSKHTR